MDRLIKFRIIKIIAVTALVLFFIPGSSQAFASSKETQLAHKVQRSISRYFDNNLNVTATGNGIVTIKGNVNSLYDKYRIFDIADRVTGVKEIKDMVAINTPIVPDKMIKEHLLEEIRLDRAILEPNRIKVHVDNGEIELDGNVSYYREKLMAESIASWQKGAKGIIDNIKVLPAKEAVSDQNLTIILGDILKDHFPRETKVRFTVKKGIAEVSGYTHTLWAKKHIETDFRRVKGIKDVINNIKTAPEQYLNWS